MSAARRADRQAGAGEAARAQADDARDDHAGADHAGAENAQGDRAEAGGARAEDAAGEGQRRRPRLNPVARVLVGTAGGLLVVIGVALLVLPGPGMLLVLAGLVLLSRAIPAVARFEAPVRAKAMQGVEASVANGRRIAGSMLAGFGLIGAGVVWGMRAVPRLPFAGWSTGLSLVLSGLIVLGLLAWSYRRVRSRAAAAATDAADAADAVDATDAGAAAGEDTPESGHR